MTHPPVHDLALERGSEEKSWRQDTLTCINLGLDLLYGLVQAPSADFVE